MEGCRWGGLWLGVGVLSKINAGVKVGVQYETVETTAHWSGIKSNNVPQCKLTLAFSVDCYRDGWSTQQRVMMIYGMKFFFHDGC